MASGWSNPKKHWLWCLLQASYYVLSHILLYRIPPKVTAKQRYDPTHPRMNGKMEGMDPVEYCGTCRGGYKLATRRASAWVRLLLKGLLDRVLDSPGYCTHPAGTREDVARLSSTSVGGELAGESV